MLVLIVHGQLSSPMLLIPTLSGLHSLKIKPFMISILHPQAVYRLLFPTQSKLVLPSSQQAQSLDSWSLSQDLSLLQVVLYLNSKLILELQSKSTKLCTFQPLIVVKKNALMEVVSTSNQVHPTVLFALETPI